MATKPEKENYGDRKTFHRHSPLGTSSVNLGYFRFPTTPHHIPPSTPLPRHLPQPFPRGSSGLRCPEPRPRSFHQIRASPLGNDANRRITDQSAAPQVPDQRRRRLEKHHPGLGQMVASAGSRAWHSGLRETANGRPAVRSHPDNVSRTFCASSPSFLIIALPGRIGVTLAPISINPLTSAMPNHFITSYRARKYGHTL